MIELKQVNFQYDDKKILNNIDLTLEQGKICTLIGRSGVGKTTLLKIMAGIYQEFDGHITINGIDIDPIRNNIGYIPQNYGLVPWKTVKKNIRLPRQLKYGRKKKDKVLFHNICKELGIVDILEKYPAFISGGQSQRVAIARALYLEPQILLMDEPFSSLDFVHREEARKLFLRVWEKHKITTVMVTHDIEEAIYLGHIVGVLDTSNKLVINENPFLNKDDKENVEAINSFREQLKHQINL